MNVIEWLLAGDPSIKYLVTRDLLGQDDRELRSAIGSSGWCREFIRNRNADGGWGRRFYQPKWICSHYTLCELRKLEYSADDPLLLSEINRIGIEEAALDGGINPAVSIETSDVCVTAMYLDYAVFFGADPGIIRRIVDYLLSMRMSDGGFNCNLNQCGAVHSSLHTSVCVLEAWTSYADSGNQYRHAEIRKSMKEIAGFILEHRLFRSSGSGEIIDKKMLMLTYPFRWKYTVLRGLNALAGSDVPYDGRMEEALTFIEQKRLKDRKWKAQANYPGQVFFTMEEAGKASRMITYLCLKILKKYRGESVWEK